MNLPRRRENNCHDVVVYGSFFRCQTAPWKYSYMLGGMVSLCSLANVFAYHFRVQEAVTANAAMPLVMGEDVRTPLRAFRTQSAVAKAGGPSQPRAFVEFRKARRSAAMMRRKTSLILLGAAAGVGVTLIATHPRIVIDGARALSGDVKN
jgi:hypothetical protein